MLLQQQVFDANPAVHTKERILIDLARTSPDIYLLYVVKYTDSPDETLLKKHSDVFNEMSARTPKQLKHDGNTLSIPIN
jgi:hypothetical protein